MVETLEQFYYSVLIDLYINLNYNDRILQKIIELKLLKDYKYFTLNNKILINQHNFSSTMSLLTLTKAYNLNMFINLPNKVFFETSELYINNEGSLKKKN